MRPIKTLCYVLGIFALVAQSRATEYPNRPIKIVVAFAPGGVADTAARLLADGLQRSLHQTIIVENRPGAGGNVAAAIVSRAAPDGHTLLVTTTAFSINLTLNQSHQLHKGDFRAIAFPAFSPEVMVVNSNSGVADLADLIKKGRQKSLNFGTAGFGSASHIMAEHFFRNIAKVSAVHIPFQGGPPAIAAILGNQIDVMAGILGGGVAAQISSGKLRGIAIAADKRAAVVPSVPTFAESGYDGMQFSDWVGVFVPEKTEPAVATKLASEIERIVKEPGVREKLTAMGFEPSDSAGTDAQHKFEADVDRWAALIHSLDLKLN